MRVMSTLNLLSASARRVSNQQALRSRPLLIAAAVFFIFLIFPRRGTSAQPAAAAAAAQTFADTTLINDGNPPPADCSPMSPTVIVYNRIPKAGSTTLLALLREMSEANDFLIDVPHPKHNQPAARQAINQALESRKKTVIVQHFHFPDVIDNRVAYINVMRHPVDRCVSAYHYLRFGDRKDKNRRAAVRRYGSQSLDECMELPPEQLPSCLNCPSQAQARFFCGAEGGVCDKPSAEEMLRRSWYNLKSQYTVGLTEDLESTIGVLESLFPAFFRGMGDALGRTPPQRVSSEIAEYKEPTQKTKEAIAKWSAVDMDIYTRVAEELKALHKVCMARRASQKGG